MSDEQTNGSGPLSWRDVYKAVGDSKAEVLGAVDDLKETFGAALADHETRIRANEKGLNFFTNREEGLRLAGKLGSIVFHVLVGLASAAGTFLMLQGAGAFK